MVQCFSSQDTCVPGCTIPESHAAAQAVMGVFASAWCKLRQKLHDSEQLKLPFQFPLHPPSSEKHFGWMHHWSKAASQPLDNVTLQLHVRISQAQHISLPRRRRHLLCLRRKCKIVCNRTKHRHWQFSVADWAKESGKLAEGKWQINTCSWTGGNKYEIWFGGKSSWKMLNIEVENWPKGSGKLAEGRKGAPQPHPVDLC